MKNATIESILNKKGASCHTIGQQETVISAAVKMTRSKVGSLLVTNGRSIAGIVTERDCLRFLARFESDVDRGTRVQEIMTVGVVVVRPDQTLEECLGIMTQQRCRHLPVVDPQNGDLIGMISIGDLVKAAVTVQQSEIHTLRDYILGNYPGVGLPVRPSAPSLTLERPSATS